MNKIIILGNVGQLPQIKQLSGDVKVANLTVAVNEKYINKNGEKKEKTEWFNVICWRQTAGIVEKFVTKGTRILIEGKMTFRNYTDDQGVKKIFPEVVCEKLTILTWKTEDDNKQPIQATESNPFVLESNPFDSDDIF